MPSVQQASSASQGTQQEVSDENLPTQHVHVSDFQYPPGLSVRVIELDPGPTTSSEGSREYPIEVDKSPPSLEILLQEHAMQVVNQSYIPPSTLLHYN